jgi:hypothetical protein
VADREHQVRNALALLRGHLELAVESLDAGRTSEAAPDVADALAAAHRLEALLLPPEEGAPS